MKRIIKSTLSVLLAAIIVFGSVPLAGFMGVDLPNVSKLFETKAKAIEASDLPTDFELVKYNVETIFSSKYGEGTPYNIFYDDISKYSCSKVVYNAFSQDANFVASAEAWEAIRLVSNPSHITECLEYQQQYEEVIFAVLFSALKNEKYAELSYSNMLTKVTGVTDNLLSTSRTAELLDKTSLDGTEADDIKDIAFTFLTKGKDVESKWAAFGEYTNIVEKCNSIIDKSISSVVNAANIITSTVMYVSMLEQGAEILTYLTDLKAKSPNSVFGAAVSTVINTLCQDWIGVVEKTIIDSGFVICMEAADKLVDYAWTGCCAMCPFLGGMAIGEVIGTLACNILFSTEDLIEQYEYLKIVTQLETAACSLYQQYGNSCKSSVNSTNAAKLMFATDFSCALYNLGAEAAVEMMNIGCNKGIVNNVANIFGVGKTQGFDEFEESVESCVNSFETGYSNMKNYWKFCIEEDYPEFFETLTEKIEPQYIESINIEKNEVTFRVGEVMNFKWTINPTGYEGGVGLKSDNEGVIKSSAPMDILAYATNTGTANVTIYSLNNPEICDTIKITVIGEDDEGTTEADSKYVTGKCGDNLTWVLNQNTGRLIISGTGTMDNYSYNSSPRAPWYNYDVLKVDLNYGVTSIGKCAFYTYLQRENKLEWISIPDTVTHIGARAFEGCNKLAYINLPDSIIKIENDAFAGTSLFSVTIPPNVQNMGESVFYGCRNLKTVIFNAKNCKGVSEESNWPVFRVSSAQNIYIGSQVEVINPGIFNDCYEISNITFSEDGKLSSISSGAFAFCSGLKNIKIPSGITSIGNGAFRYCDNLIEIDIPDSVSYIGERSFYGTGYYNNKINWEKGVLYIDNHLIEANTDISDHYSIKSGTKTIASKAFQNCNRLTQLTIPKSVANISINAFYGCDGITTLNYCAQNCLFTSDERSAFELSNLSTVILGENVKSIPAYAFRNCDNLSTVVLSDSITSIDDYAFTECSGLTNINLPSGITNIGKGAFSYCDSLIEIDIPDGVKNMGDNVFYGCKSLTSITIPCSVTSIGEDAFFNCTSLANATIPVSVTTIGNFAFHLCDSLTDVYYLGTEAQWKSITIGSYNSSLTNAMIHCQNIPSSHSHYYSSIVTQKPTCTKTGMVTYTCDCGDSYIESIPVTSHTASDWQIVLEPTTETEGKKIKKCTVCGITLSVETIVKLPKEVAKDDAVVKSPSTSSISYGDSIILHVNESKIPEGGYVEWTADNNNFSYKADGAICTISPEKSGDTTFTATIYDAEGNAVSADEQTMTSKAGFFQKIIAFFKKLFGLTKTIPQAFKGII